MAINENPFTVIFGMEPQSVIHRNNSDKNIISIFESTNPRTPAYAIVGVRGCGKTVLMTRVQTYFLQKKDWIVLRLNPGINYYESAISQMSESVSLKKDLVTDINIQVAGIGAGLSKKSLLNNETLLKKMLVAAAKGNKKVLITIDEVSNTENFKTFAHSYQAFIGERLNVFLLVTALPENLNGLCNSKDVTFLRRLPKIHLDALNDTMISNEYAKIFNISQDEADDLARIVKGYPFAYQVLGDLLWENNTKFPDDEIMKRFDALLDESVYTPIWNTLPEKEKEILRAMAESGQNSIKSIRALLNMQSNEFSPYRERLMIRGLINAQTYGNVFFVLPRFKEFIIRKMRFEV